MCYDTTKNPIGYNNKNSNTYGTAQEQHHDHTRSHMQHFKNQLRGVETVSLTILMNKTAARLSCERNSCHAPQLEIF